MMKRLLLSALSSVGVVVGGFAADDTSPAPTTITTLSGKTYRAVQILKAYPDGLAFRHANGAAQISFTDLPESVQTRFQYNPEAAKAYVKEHVEAERLAAEKVALARAERRKKEAEVKLAALQLAMLREQSSSGAAYPVVGYTDYGVPTWGYGYGAGYDQLPPLGQSVGWDGRRSCYGYGYGSAANNLFYNYSTTKYIGPNAGLYSGSITNSNVRPFLTFGGYNYPTALASRANVSGVRVSGHRSNNGRPGGINPGRVAARPAFVPANTAGARIGGNGGVMRIGSPRISHR